MDINIKEKISKMNQLDRIEFNQENNSISIYYGIVFLLYTMLIFLLASQYTFYGFVGKYISFIFIAGFIFSLFYFVHKKYKEKRNLLLKYFDVDIKLKGGYKR